MNYIAIKLIQIYKKLISPFLPNACRFHPTCSEYAKQAFLEYNFFYASYLSAKRILKCNPFWEGYFDPIPKKEMIQRKNGR